MQKLADTLCGLFRYQEAIEVLNSGPDDSRFTDKQRFAIEAAADDWNNPDVVIHVPDGMKLREFDAAVKKELARRELQACHAQREVKCD